MKILNVGYRTPCNKHRRIHEEGKIEQNRTEINEKICFYSVGQIPNYEDRLRGKRGETATDCGK